VSIAVLGQPRQKVSKTPSQSIAGYNGVGLSSQVALESEIGRISVPGQQEQKIKILKKNWAWWCTPVITVTVRSLQ
jgi:hypothetical protein